MKLVKCRKPHICGYCGQTIEISEYAVYGSVKSPTYNGKGVQTGILYERFYLHPVGHPRCTEDNLRENEMNEMQDYSFPLTMKSLDSSELPF